MRASFLVLLPALGAFAAGCGPDCQSTCNKIYAESECNIPRPGSTRDELLSDCEDSCEAALDKEGAIRAEYVPSERVTNDEPVEYSNDQEVALWMDCVVATSCELLDDGYCAPI
jgi:hypothetical protein